MRLRLDVETAARQVPWAKVLSPGRGLAYRLLSRAAPDLATWLHDIGWGPHSMVPIAHGAPVFPGARRRPGVYAAGGRGVLEFGSPLPEIVDAMAYALQAVEMIDWGGLAMHLTGVAVAHPPPFTSGRARMRTVTPVVMKGSGLDERGRRRTRQDWLLPQHPEFPGCVEKNLWRKAETVGCLPDVRLDSITWVGSQRSFTTGDAARPGAPLEVELSGDPRTLRAIWSWGLGQSNVSGFGWIAN